MRALTTIHRAKRVWRSAAAVIAVLAAVVPSVAYAGPNDPFTTLAPGFTQSLYATSLTCCGGVAFAPNGDPLFVSGSIFDINASATTTVHGSTVHPVTVISPAAPLFFGVVNVASGAIYANTSNGVYKIDAAGNILAGPFGAAGNGLGITVDPQTGNLVYPDNSGNISWVNQGFTASGVFATGATSDGLTFEPGGNYLFAAEFGGGINVYNRAGSLVQNIPNSGAPDGMAFHAGTPNFLVSNNNDGSITRYDFAGGDYTQAPTQSVFASGGFRGDITQVGTDGCLYATQGGTRFADGTVTTDGSLVQICPGFIPPAPVSDTDLAIANVPANQTVNATSPSGATVTFTLPTATDEDATAPTVTCDHASGSTFSIGTTTVTCTATDSDDSPSTATGTFTVTVKGASAQLADLLAFDQGLPPGHAFRDKTQATINDVNAGNTASACTELQGIISLANAQRGKAITTAQANTIITDAARIRSVLGC